MKRKKNKNKYYSTQATHTSIFSKIILIILIIGMILGHLNIGAVVKAMQPEEHINLSEEIERDFSDFENISEVDELRTENSKTYLKENGMYETEYYSEKVHYKDNNKWKDIDNSLKLKNDRYHNNSNRFSVSFPNKLNKNNEVVLDYLSKELKIYYDLNADNNASLNDKIDRSKKNLRDEISYKINDNETIQYVIQQDSIKENIILNSYIKNYEYSYYIDTDLRVERIGNQIYFYDGIEEIYVIDEYYMYDANSVSSKDIDFDIVVIDEDTYKIKVTPSDDFLKIAKYPIMIDPEIVIRDGGYLDGVFTVTTLDMLTNTTQFKDIGEFTINNRLKSSSADDVKAFFNVTIPYEYTVGNMYDVIGKNQFMYASISVPTTSTNASASTEIVLNHITKNDSVSAIDYTDSSTYTSTYIDSQFFHSTNVFDHSFDVYNIVKATLNDLKTSNVGFCFELCVNQGNNNTSVTYSLGGDLTGDKPVLKLGYLSDAGLANYYTYESFPISNESNVYVAHNSGNLTYLFNDYTDNNLLNFSHVFNANRKDINSFYGNGFSINYNEYITTLDYDYRLKLTEGDGREVIFYSINSSNTEYIAGDGSGEILTRLLDVNSSVTEYEIKNSDGGVSIYNSNGKLTKIYLNEADRVNGEWISGAKHIELNYDENNTKIIQVEDSVGNIINLNYSTSGLLRFVELYRYNPDIDECIYAGEIYYEYLNNNLICITKYINGLSTNTVNIEYNNKNHISKVYENLRGYSFEYDNQNRVIQAKIYSNSFTNGDYLSFVYNTNGKKTVTTNGLGEKTSYTFDDYYHTNSVESPNGYTIFYKYEDIYYNENGEVITNPNYNKNHKIKNQSNSFKNIVNQIENHGFEIVTGSSVYGWTKSLTGSSSATIDTSTILYGSSVLKLYKNSSGTAKVYQDIEVVSGQEYIVSGYIKNANSSGDGAYISVSGIDGTITTVESSSSVLGSTSFSRYEYKFRANFTGTARINLINGSTGYAYFDNIQISTSYLDTRYNYLNNSSFEDSTLVGWTGVDYMLESRENTNRVGTSNDYGFFGEHCGNQTLKLASGGYVSQTINVSGTEGDIFVFGGYCFYENYTGNVSVRIILETDTGTIYKSFTYDENDINAVYHMEKVVATENYYSVTIEISNNSNSSYANLDNFAIYKEGYGINLGYTEDGLIQEEYNELTGEITSYTYYDGTKNIETITTEDGTTNVDYDNKNNITSIESNNVTSSFEVNNDGSIESSTITADGTSNQYFSGDTTYIMDGLYPKTSTDIHGTVTTNSYDYITGLVTNINTANTNSNININQQYTYDKHGNVLSETKSSSNTSKTITYTYDKFGNLTSITDGACVYTLTYNKYGDLDTIKVGSLELVNYNYTNESSTSIYTGEVNNIKYNYGTIYFEYNELHQVEKIYHNTKTTSGLVLEYLYNDYGEISSYTDHLENVTYYYNYDYQNRLITINASNGNNFKYTYDENSNLVSERNINGTNNYTYTDDKITREDIISFYFKTYTYSSDSFEQLQTINYYIDVMGDTPTIQNNFVYETKNVNGKTTYTGRINEAIYVVDGDTLRFVYEYDIFSNITKITKYINNVVDYVEENTYDIFNQLTQQVLTKENVTYSTSYTYDSRGNVTNIIESNETEGDITSIISLTYNDKNELLSVNDYGTLYTNTYSSNGMLTKYLGWNISYDMRNISSLNNGDTSIDFEYNADGIRISKIINNTTTIDYTLDGTNIIREKSTGANNYQIDYYYDSNGSIIGFRYNYNHYIYLKNIQNDIIGIVDESGNLVVEYMYDAYGNICYMIDNSGISLGTINPFRYRSYYFDNETGWYYLNSRYYNPELARFVTMDEIEFLGYNENIFSYNLYSYCENNPTKHIDSDGNAAANIIGGIVGGAAGATLGYLLAELLNLKGLKKIALIAAATVGGAVLGAFLGPYIAKLGTKVATKLGLSGTKSIKLSSDSLWKKFSSHMFSKDHMKKGIMNLGKSQKGIFNNVIKIVKSKLHLAIDGPNQINTIMNGFKVSIRFFIQNGQVTSINLLMGGSTLLGHLIS